ARNREPSPLGGRRARLPFSLPPKDRRKLATSDIPRPGPPDQKSSLAIPRVLRSPRRVPASSAGSLRRRRRDASHAGQQSSPSSPPAFPSAKGRVHGETIRGPFPDEPVRQKELFARACEGLDRSEKEAHLESLALWRAGGVLRPRSGRQSRVRPRAAVRHAHTSAFAPSAHAARARKSGLGQMA